MKLDPALIQAAQAAETKWTIPTSVTLAQYGLESGWGEHMPPGSNNPLGIKAVAGQPAVVVKTREEDSYGQSYYVNAPFRKFASLAQAFDEHGRLLAQGRYYAHARAALPNVDAFVDALEGVYATAHGYANTLKTIMRGMGLYALNVNPAGRTPSPAKVPLVVAHSESATAPAQTESEVLNQRELDLHRSTST